MDIGHSLKSEGTFGRCFVLYDETIDRKNSTIAHHIASGKEALDRFLTLNYLLYEVSCAIEFIAMSKWIGIHIRNSLNRKHIC